MKGRTDRSKDILRRDDLSFTILSDLNPIEFFWKCITRIIFIFEIENRDELIDIVRYDFFGLTQIFPSHK